MNNSGPVYIPDLDLTLKLRVDEIDGLTNVKLIIDNDIYDNLSVKTPDSKKLDRGEFFINPGINSKITKELVNQNFIQCTDETSTFGNKITISYMVNFS